MSKERPGNDKAGKKSPLKLIKDKRAEKVLKRNMKSTLGEG
jgi:hypothetical protein